MACVRACPVEAISVRGSDLEIVDSACTECGFCVPACPHDAIDVVGDTRSVEGAIESGRALLILPSEAIVGFYPATPEQLVNACLSAGFRSVFFDNLGDELVAAEYLRLWKENEAPGTWIRSTSPIVVDYVRAKYPELVPYLAPVVTPTIALARFLRHAVEDSPIVYAGVHSAGPQGADEVDASLSLAELGGRRLALPGRARPFARGAKRDAYGPASDPQRRSTGDSTVPVDSGGVATRDAG
jgi:hypothetical protein